MIITLEELCNTYGTLICLSFAFGIVIQMAIYGFIKAFSLVKI